MEQQEPNVTYNVLEIIDEKYLLHPVKVAVIEISGHKDNKEKKYFIRLNDISKTMNKQLGGSRKTKQFKKEVLLQSDKYGYDVEYKYKGDNSEQGYYYSEDGIESIAVLLDHSLLEIIIQTKKKLIKNLQEENDKLKQQIAVVKEPKKEVPKQQQCIVQQQKKQTLYDYTIQQLKNKNVPEQMIQFFVSRISDELIFIDQDKAIQILQYKKQDYVTAVKKGVLNKDVTVTTHRNGNNSIQTGQFEEEQRYNISLNFLLKLLKKRDISKLNEESKKAVQLHLQYLELIEETHINYIKHVEQKNEDISDIEIENEDCQEDEEQLQIEDEDLEEMKEDSEGNLHDHNGKIVQHNQQLQVIQQEVSNIDDMTVAQLYMTLGKLQCVNINEKQKRLYVKLIQLRIEILTKNEDKERELAKKDREILYQKLENKNKELRIRELEHEKQIADIESSVSIPWSFYLMFAKPDFETLRAVFYVFMEAKKLYCTQQKIPFQGSNYFQEFYDQHKNNLSKDIQVIQAAPSTVDIQNKPIYAGIAKDTRLLQRPYEHIQEVLKYCALVDQLNGKKCLLFGKILKTYKQMMQHVIQVKIYKMSKSEDDMRNQESQLITQCQHEYLTNFQNFLKYKDGRTYKKIHEYAKEFELFNI